MRRPNLSDERLAELLPHEGGQHEKDPKIKIVTKTARGGCWNCQAVRRPPWRIPLILDGGRGLEILRPQADVGMFISWCKLINQWR